MPGINPDCHLRPPGHKTRSPRLAGGAFTNVDRVPAARQGPSALARQASQLFDPVPRSSYFVKEIIKVSRDISNLHIGRDDDVIRTHLLAVG